MFRRRASAGKLDTAVRDGGEQTGVTERPGPAASDSGVTERPGPAASDSDEPAEPWGTPPAGLDVSVPHPARVWNYWLGGRDFFAADKVAGEQISREFPHLAQTARAERAFLVRAVRFLVGPARIRQFLDVGAGLPAGGNTHEIAQRIAPDAGVVYTDNDPVVIMHAKALLGSPMLAGKPGGAVCYADADLRDVAAVLAAAASTLDMSRPVALIMVGILGHLNDYGAARSITSQLMDALPAGSYLVIADGVAGGTADGLADGVAASPVIGSAQRRYDDSTRTRYGANAPGPYLLRRPDELVSFFDGLDLVEPGVVPCPRWRPDGHRLEGHRPEGHSGGAGDGAGDDDAAAYCGIARRR